MKVGVNIAGLVQFADGQDPSAQFRTILDWVGEIEELGFDYVYFGQHYLTEPYQAFQAVPLLSRLAAETDRLRLGATLVVPLHHPVELAEHLATVDVMSSGRLFLSGAMGYRDNEFAAFGIDLAKRGQRYRESLQVIRRLWAEDRVTFHGEHFAIDDAKLMLKPLQRPGPPVWVAANGDRTVTFAARSGLPWHINPHSTRDTIERQSMLYRAEAADAGLPPLLNVLNREAYCAPTSEQAWEQAGPHLAAKYSSYADWGQDKQLPAGEMSFRNSLADLARDRFVVGDVETCIRELTALNSLGIGAMHFRIGWPGMDSSLSRESLRLFGSEVLPTLTPLVSTHEARSPFEAITPAGATDDE